MQVTRITNKNEKPFLPLFPGSALKASEDLVRLGILDDEGAVAGGLSARIYDRFIDILSLYIVPSFRRQGYGKKLLDTLADTAKAHGYEALTAEFTENTAALDFSGAMGFENFESKDFYFFTLKEFLRSPLYKKLVKGKKDNGISYVSALSLSERKIFERHIGTRHYDPEWSTVCFEDGEYRSALLTEHELYTINGEKHNSVAILLLDAKENRPTDILHHIQALARKAINEFGEEADVTFRTTFANETIMRNMFELLGRKTHLHREGCFIHAVKLL